MLGMAHDIELSALSPHDVHLEATRLSLPYKKVHTVYAKVHRPNGHIWCYVTGITLFDDEG